MQKLHIGIIGCGSITRERHAPECAANDQVQISGFYDRTASHAKDLVDKYGGQVYQSVAEMLTDQTIDAVIICTPNSLHAEMAVDALQHGKDVFCEKPMATSLADCRKMVTVAKQEGRRLMVDQNQRLAPAHQEAKELIDAGLIGKPLTFKTNFGHGGPETWSIAKSNQTWFFDSKKSKYGAVFDLGIHKIDLMRYLLDEDFTSVYGKLATLDKRDANHQLITVDDNALGILEMANGVIGYLAASWTYYGEEDNSTIIYGTNGIMKIYDDPTYSIKLILKDGEKVNYEIGQIQTNDHQTNSGVIDEFSAAIIDGRPSILDANTVINSMQTVFALIESSRKKEAITLS